jgi:AcrR family transcriptional regulator
VRYGRLLDAAERLVGREGPAGLSIRNLASEAGVPMASVYHFFPRPAAISVALAELYLEGLAAAVERPMPGHEAMGWETIVRVLVDRGVEYYREHPYAQALLLGSAHSWHIRQADVANNRRFANSITQLLAGHFAHVELGELHEAVIVGVTLCDAVLALGIVENGAIAPPHAREAHAAICGYLTRKFGA